MALFQNSVIKKHLQALNQESIQEKWQKFQAHFFNATIQDNIRNSKEEQYQGEFLIDLFVNILGYTKNPTPNFNLTTEYKNVKDSKKADGAILIDDKVRAVIELKGTNTTDLGKIEAQAFGYKNNQPECVYVITSNFEKLRFYIDNAIEHIEFNLFQLSKTEFELLYLCLAYDNIKNNVAKSIKDQSVSEEDVITKKLYKDYSLFKRELFQNLVQLNPQHDPLVLFQKTQKLLDRFLFIFFAEDRNLLPTNLIFRINKEWQQLQQMRIQVSLYDRYKTYFDDLNTGAKVQLPAFSQTNSIAKEEHQIFAYNGGLFKADDILDNIKIDDAVLFQHTEKLSNYDFASEVDVNILGHIFENSLNELDEIKAELEGEVIDKTKTKRKKDGVFYTPKYITKYIVENTIGKLCSEKKIELQLNEEDYTTDKKRQKKTLQGLIDKLQLYRNWLLQLTICDPACGSGAFLNQALDFLIEEHKYIDELQAKLFGDTFILSDVENSILENNLFGVDLNEESVEIAKLSLWLRTAQPNRKLNDLSGNIKCGNSLVDDPEIEGDKAFNWQQAFPQVFVKGGFDVIIGNPPYVFTRGNDHFKKLNEFIWDKYKYNKGKLNLYSVFLELTLSMILKPKGCMGFITPETFIRTSTYQEIRKFIINNYNLRTVQIYGIGVFENVTAETVVMLIDNYFEKNNISYFEKIINENSSIVYEEVQNNFNNTPENRFVYGNSKLDEILFKKLKKDNILLGEIVDVRNGVATKSGKNDFISKSILTEKYKKLLEAPELFRYGFKWAGNYINYDKEVLHRPRKEETFLSDKIMIQRVSSRLICSFDNEQFYTFNSVNNLIIKKNNFSLKYLITILNSKIIDYFYRRNYSLDASYTITVTKQNLDSIPIPNLSMIAQNTFIEKADLILSLNKELQEISTKFQRTLQRKFELDILPKKLENWYELSFSEFVKELAKKKVKLSLSEEAEWEDYFLQEQQKAVAIKNEIVATDKAIDKMVYELYGLSEEEISIVEGS
jgi:type I restriction-modification system DNA methylase subunit